MRPAHRPALDSGGEPAPPPTRHSGGPGAPPAHRPHRPGAQVTEPLLRALNRMRGLLLDADVLVRAVASGRQKGEEPPLWRRVELRYVDLKAGRQLQITKYDATQAFTSNHPVSPASGEPGAREAVDELIDLPFGHWNVATTTEDHALRVTKKLEAGGATTPRATPVEVSRGHDQAKGRLLPEDDPVFVALGIS